MFDSGKYQGLFGLVMGISLHLRSRQSKLKPWLNHTCPDIFPNQTKTCISKSWIKTIARIGIHRLNILLFWFLKNLSNSICKQKLAYCTPLLICCPVGVGVHPVHCPLLLTGLVCQQETYHIDIINPCLSSTDLSVI